MPAPANDTALDPIAAARVAQHAWEMAEQARHRWTGERWVDGRDLREIARLVRADLARAQIHARVALARYSGGQRLTVRITPPAGMTLCNPVRVRQVLDPDHVGPLADRLTVESAQLLRTAEGIVQAYNRSWDDRCREFHLDADFADGLYAAERERVVSAMLPA